MSVLRRLWDHPVRHVLQNTAMAVPLLRALARRAHRTGAMNDPEEVRRRARRVTDAMEAEGRPVAGARLVEVGPGHTLGVGVALLLAGASELGAVDTHAYASPSDPAPFLPLAGEDAVRGALGRLRCRLAGRDGRWPLEDGTADVVYSFSVLEHVRSVEAVLGEAWRVLRPGGLTIHSIDLRDHFRLDPGEDWLRFLRYSDRRWELMTSRRSNWCNRLRAPELRDVFSRRFELRRFEEERLPLPEGFGPDRLAPRFRALDPRTLGVSMVWVVGAKARG